jgi:hypothetical protein
MSKTPNYRYNVKVKIKSTNKKEVIEELEALIMLIKLPDTVSCGFGGDSGTCFADGEIKAR